MDRNQLLLVGLPLFLLISDIFNLFTPPSSPPKSAHHHHHHHHTKPPSLIQQQTPHFPSQKPNTFNAIGFGNTITINFCSSCSYRGTAMTMKNMLETQFPGSNIVLANYPPPFHKRVISKLVPVFQFGIIGIIIGGEQIFPKLGYLVPPQWYYTLKANKFGSISTTWLFGNVIQSFMQGSGAFEVYCNGVQVFSKLKENRFPGEFELKELIGQRIVHSRVIDGYH